jgi:hypothetical protein
MVLLFGRGMMLRLAVVEVFAALCMRIFILPGEFVFSCCLANVVVEVLRFRSLYVLKERAPFNETDMVRTPRLLGARWKTNR